jgi:hypothetical protein
MQVRKAVAGSVIAAGALASLFGGAGMASAAPGVSFDNGTGGTNTVHFGDTSPETGATAVAATGNRALAVNITSKTGTQALAEGTNNNVVAIDGVAITGPDTRDNNVVSAFGVTQVGGTSHHNNVVTVAGATDLEDAHDNTVLNAGGLVTSADQGDDTPGAVSLSVCGTGIGAQAAHITVTNVGVCGGAS